MRFLRLALQLARRGYGATSPNPMVGAVLVKRGEIIGRGWHRRAGRPHAEIEALHDAQRRGHSARGATLYVTLEPCSTQGRTPPCTEAIRAAGIRRVVVGATDPNPQHAGRGLEILRQVGIAVSRCGEAVDALSHTPPLWRQASLPASEGGLPAASSKPRGRDAALTGPQGCGPPQSLARECARLNEAFNHWIVHRTPFVTVKAAMTLDGKIATASGESKWITGPKSRAYAMKLRRGADAILVGINTVLADDPSLTVRSPKSQVPSPKSIRRVILDSKARTPLGAKVVSDADAALTTIVVGPGAPKRRVAALAKRVTVLAAPCAKSAIGNRQSAIPLRWLWRQLGAQGVTSLLVEGGGEVNASFLSAGLAHRVAFFYAPKVLGGRAARKGVAGEGAQGWPEILRLEDLRWRRLGEDLLLTARVK